MNLLNITPPLWYNSTRYAASYLRMYKSGSSSMVALMVPGEDTSVRPRYPERAFTVVRDPYDRSRSIYTELRSLGKVRDTESYLAYLRRTLRKGFFDKHQVPQRYWIERSEVREVRLFRLDDLQPLCNWLGCRLGDIPQLNAKSGSHEHTPEESHIVRALYAQDFECQNDP